MWRDQCPGETDRNGLATVENLPPKRPRGILRILCLALAFLQPAVGTERKRARILGHRMSENW